jgi:BirA family transcriptional regulator, biotin operon repressor / biotin---[acetyl-CoA-carboxylase] ligase
VYEDLDRPPLDEAGLRRATVAPRGPWRRLDVVEQIGSTNAELRERARSGEAAGAVLVAEEQTSGRGRLGRTWSAPARSGLAVSVLLRPEAVPSARWGWLPLLVGLAAVRGVDAVADAVVDAADPRVGLKWPNDVMVGDRKTGGVLVERVETDQGPAAVAGLGLNVSLRDDELPVPQATSLRLAGRQVDRDPLLRAYLRALADLVQRWQRGESLRDEYRQECLTLGRQVSVALPGGRPPVTGEAVDVDDAGRLVVVAAGGVRQALSAGEVQHVR